jgi:hypothetical protein
VSSAWLLASAIVMAAEASGDSLRFVIALVCWCAFFILARTCLLSFSSPIDTLENLVGNSNRSLPIIIQTVYSSPVVVGPTWVCNLGSG